eukprot:3167412-Amphidinium_carterae.1
MRGMLPPIASKPWRSTSGIVLAMHLGQCASCKPLESSCNRWVTWDVGYRQCELQMRVFEENVDWKDEAEKRQQAEDQQISWP